MFKSLILFIFLISSHALGNEKVTGSYVGEIEDKYKNTYPVTSNLEISDGGVIKGTYKYKYFLRSHPHDANEPTRLAFSLPDGDDPKMRIGRDHIKPDP